MSIINQINKIFQDNLENCIKDINKKLFLNENLYDYSKLENIYSICFVYENYRNINVSTDEGYNFLLGTLLKQFKIDPETKYSEKNCVYTECKQGEKTLPKHYELLKDEKVIFLWNNYPKYNLEVKCNNYVCNNFSRGNTGENKIIFVTNYSKVFYFQEKTLKYAHYNFWLPVDYILILKSLVVNNFKDSYAIYNTEYQYLSKEELDLKFPNYGTQIDPNTIFSTLELMKNTVNNRSFIPPYINTIFVENETLKIEIETLKLENEKLKNFQKMVEQMIEYWKGKKDE
jgi:hypothetical protein